MALMARTRRVSRAVVLALCLAGCISLPPEPPAQGRLSLRAEPQEVAAIGERPEWGLALSGGGLRSALFTIGVMKALFDAEQFNQFRVISTVSGGSYAAYWLYTNELAEPRTGPFGATSFQRDNFNLRTCELMSTGNFVTFRSMVTRGLTRSGAVRLYDDRLRRTFGPRDTEPPMRLARVGNGGSGAVPPYLIINSTLIHPRPLGWRTGLYEASPLIAGNAEYGYLPWSDNSPVMRQMVSVSGAAVQPLLKQPIVTPSERLNRLRPVATDGGTSENLGAIALIRRGVRNIVIVDAEHDPRFQFGAYVNLRDRLRSYDAVLNIPSLEAATARGVRNPAVGQSLHIGTVTSRAADGSMVTSTIYYLKMRISTELERRLADTQALGAGEAFHKSFRSAWLDNPTHSCSGVVNVPPLPTSLFIYNVAGYGRYINERSPIRFTNRLPPLLRGQFPQYLTPDQSYYNDQVLAFVGLGYLEGEEVSAAIAGAH